MSTLERVKYYRDRRDRALSGKHNCIPLPFQRFRNFLPGTERGKYVIITANQKVGKSKLADYLYVYNNILFCMKHPEIRVRILYFTLEMSPKAKKDEFLSFLLNHLDGIIVSPVDLSSIDSSRPVSEEILNLLESDRYKPYIDKYDEMVTYIEEIRNPTGIHKFCRDYALANGHINYTDQTYKDSEGRIKQLINKNNPYTFNYEEEYRIIVVDNASNFTQEQGLNKMDTINKMSKYFITLRDLFQYTVVLIQHQSQMQEGIENRKLNLTEPSSDGLADCKTTSRDANLLLGLYSPFKFGIPEYEGYDIKTFKNYIRFLTVLEDRDYGANGQRCPLFFNGAVSTFLELPKPDSFEMRKVYDYVNKLNTMRENKVKMGTLFLSYLKKQLKLKNGKNNNYFWKNWGWQVKKR